MNEIIYTARTGLVKLDVANPNLDGSGTVYEIVEGAEKGVLVKSLIIKAQTDTDIGMIRFYVGSGDTKILIREVKIPKTKRSDRDISFYKIIPINLTLQSGKKLFTSTEIANEFNVIAECLEFKYPEDFKFDSLEYSARTESGFINTSNVKLDGTGAMEKIFTAGSGDKFNGCLIESIVIKASSVVQNGIVRLFIKSNVEESVPVLFAEIIIPYTFQSNSVPSFEHEVIKTGAFALRADYSIYAATEKSERFNISISGLDWSYVN